MSFPTFQVKGLSDELQGQIRQVPKFDEAEKGWLDVSLLGCWALLEGFLDLPPVQMLGNAWNC